MCLLGRKCSASELTVNALLTKYAFVKMAGHAILAKFVLSIFVHYKTKSRLTYAK